AFRVKYEGKTDSILFTCHDTFHQILTLSIQNQRTNLLPNPVKVETTIEVWCWPALEFLPSTLAMGVGKREAISQYYPEWLKSENAAEFFINVDNNPKKESNKSVDALDILAITRDHDMSFLNSRKLGSVLVMGFLQHRLTFRGFKVMIPSTFMLLGQTMLAHVEGLDGELPVKHNFDDVFVEWTVSDASIAQLQSVILPPNGNFMTANPQGNGEGKGLSVKVVTNVVGEVDIRAVVSLRNAPKASANRFEIQKTIRVLPNVLPPCNQIILRPNSTFHLSSLFKNQLNANSLRGTYDLVITSDNPTYVAVREDGLTLKADTPTTSNFIVHVGLVSPNDPWANPFVDLNKGYVVCMCGFCGYSFIQSTKIVKNKDKSYAAPQLAAFVVVAVQPNGFDLWDENSKKGYDGSMLSPTHALQLSLANKVVLGGPAKSRFSPTDNILCESMEVTLQVTMLDDLVRELTVMSNIFAYSNDSSILSIGPSSVLRVHICPW
ncbi:hypothetical protein RFI_06509, partial [Reticulomyxa filosa]